MFGTVNMNGYKAVLRMGGRVAVEIGEWQYAYAGEAKTWTFQGKVISKVDALLGYDNIQRELRMDIGTAGFYIHRNPFEVDMHPATIIIRGTGRPEAR